MSTRLWRTAAFVSPLQIEVERNNVPAFHGRLDACVDDIYVPHPWSGYVVLLNLVVCWNAHMLSLYCFDHRSFSPPPQRRLLCFSFWYEVSGRFFWLPCRKLSSGSVPNRVKGFAGALRCREEGPLL